MGQQHGQQATLLGSADGHGSLTIERRDSPQHGVTHQPTPRQRRW